MTIQRCLEILGHFNHCAAITIKGENGRIRDVHVAMPVQVSDLKGFLELLQANQSYYTLFGSKDEKGNFTGTITYKQQ